MTWGRTFFKRLALTLEMNLKGTLHNDIGRKSYTLSSLFFLCMRTIVVVMRPLESVHDWRHDKQKIIMFPPTVDQDYW